MHSQDFPRDTHRITDLGANNFFQSSRDQFPDVQFDWNETYSLSFKVSLETKIKEFQYNVLRNIVFTNEKLYLRLIKGLIRLNVPFAKTYESIFFTTAK